jgi:hypothetical protein
MPRMGLVLQGGGALGAYEYGAVTRLVELGWEPVAVAGVSIGAATAAAVAGARDGDVCASIKRLWHEITLKPLPFGPATCKQLFRCLEQADAAPAVRGYLALKRDSVDYLLLFMFVVFVFPWSRFTASSHEGTDLLNRQGTIFIGIHRLEDFFVSGLKFLQ